MLRSLLCTAAQFLHLFYPICLNSDSKRDRFSNTFPIYSSELSSGCFRLDLWLTFCCRESKNQISCLNHHHYLSLPDFSTDWQTALPHMHISVVTAHYCVGCHKATRWLGMRVTCDWQCSRRLVRVTPEERGVGGEIQEKQMGEWCKWALPMYLMAPQVFNLKHMSATQSTCSQT